MTLRDFAEECFYAGSRRGQTIKDKEPEPSFSEWWENMQTYLVVKNIAVLDGFSCCDCKQKLKEIDKIVDSMNKEE